MKIESVENADIKALLNKHSEEKYREFSSSLLPGVENMLGVRVPNLRNIAKQIAKDDWKYFLKNNDGEFFEEIMLEGFVIAYIKVPFNDRLLLIENFVPKIDNWSVCDSFSNTLKFIEKDPEEGWDFLGRYLNSDKEYYQRFGVVMLLNYFVNDDYVLKTLDELDSSKWEGFYSEIAVAWAITTCFSKFPEKTMPIYYKNNLSNFVHNKSIQKSIESRLVSNESKEILRRLKRK